LSLAYYRPLVYDHRRSFVKSEWAAPAVKAYNSSYLRNSHILTASYGLKLVSTKTCLNYSG